MSGKGEGCTASPAGGRSDGGESPFDDQDPEFQVEKIVGKRFLNGRPQVLVKWEGYPPEQSTWEPLEEMDKCLDLLSNFERQLFYECQEKAKLAKEVDQKLPTTCLGAEKQGEGSSVQAKQDEVVNEEPAPLVPTTSSGRPSTQIKPIGLPLSIDLVKQEDQKKPVVFFTQKKPVVFFTQRKQLAVVKGLVEQEDQDYPAMFFGGRKPGKQQTIVEQVDQEPPMSSSKSEPEETSIADGVGQPKGQGAPTTSSARKTAWGSNQPWYGKKKKARGGKAKAKIGNKKPSPASTQQKPAIKDVGSEVDTAIFTSCSVTLTQATQPLNSLPAVTANEAKAKKLKVTSYRKTSSDEALGAAAPLSLACCAASAAGSPEDPPRGVWNSLEALEQLTIKDPIQMELDQLLEELDSRLSRPAGNLFNLTKGCGNGGRSGCGGRRAFGDPWKQPYQGVFGLERGLEMEKVQHSFKVRGLLFLFVTWKGCSEMDTVTLPSVRYLYPQLIIDYLETLKRKRR
ncbi:uncharacterized protein LOC108024107 [Drosophila biarmipes]|uniref:uncharacterized protein LOC108024107 n=1 Tax=Drosophila biarmipes TaxID=125945 RepID=UPI0007E5EA4D|nr:uncharacterized protein LOC108024107 [Drosophila biarmipes]